MSRAQSVVAFEDVSFSYGSVPVLERITFDIAQDDFMGIVGPNGSGKTTLVKIILGLLEPDAGGVTVFGEPPRRARKRIGYVPQHAGYDRDFPASVEDLVLTGRLGRIGLARRYAATDRDKARAALADLDMAGLVGRPVGALSGGERQRALVARALVGDPELLILDEPTASVDNRVEKHFYELLKVLNQRMPIVLVTHDLGFVSTYMTRVACVNRYLAVKPAIEVDHTHVEAMYAAPVKPWRHDCEL
jgi:zinc transport system ATP-binding protein